MMKVLKNLLVVAVSVATMAMSVSAFAAATATVDYDAETQKVAVTDVADLGTDAGQMTVVVVPKDFGASSAASDIYYINQETFGAEFTAILNNMGLKAALDETKEYEVRIGGENLAAPVVFDITFEPVGSQYRLGDVTREGGDADIFDAAAIVSYVLEEADFDAEQLLLGDVDKNGGNPDIFDAAAVVSFVLEELDIYK